MEQVTRSEENPLGCFDRELTKRRRDHKEVFDFIDPDLPTQYPEPLPGWGSGRNGRTFPWSELMKGRVDDIYRDLGTEDIQINRFRV